MPTSTTVSLPSAQPVYSRVLRVLFLGAAFSVLLACGKTQTKEAPVRAVKVLTVGADHEGQTPESYAGEVRARAESKLGFRVGGKLLTRSAQLGQTVRAGQLLAQIDPRDYQLGAQAAQAQMQAALTARDLAAADLKRFEAMRAQGFISDAQIERYSAQLQSAQAQLSQAQAQASVQGNQASYGNLYADRAGVITGVYAEVGQVLAAGQPVVQLAEDGPRDAAFSLPEDAGKSLPVGSAVEVIAWNAQGTEPTAQWPGRVRELAASADTLTRTFAVKVAIEASAANAPPLGTTVRIVPKNTVQKTQNAQVLLPLSALSRESSGTSVWVFAEKTATVHKRAVKTGGIVGNQVQIISGIAAGDVVVVAGVHTLTDGQHVSRYVGKNDREDEHEGQAAPAQGAGA